MDAEIIIKWGFIGCGEVTEKKSGRLSVSCPALKSEAVRSRNKEKARSYAERHGIPKWYTDAQELVDDPDVNAVYIATPPSSLPLLPSWPEGPAGRYMWKSPLR